MIIRLKKLVNKKPKAHYLSLNSMLYNDQISLIESLEEIGIEVIRVPKIDLMKMNKEFWLTGIT